MKRMPNSIAEEYDVMMKDMADYFLIDKENVTTLYLIRHGQDELPSAGNNYDQPLSPQGVSNVHLVGKRLAKYGITQLASSPSLRARQTADIIASYIGLTNQVIDDLREIKPLNDFQSYARGLYEIIQNCRKTQRPDGKKFRKINWPAMLGVEGGQALRTRAVNTVNSILNRYQGQKIALISHHGFINAYVTKMAGLNTTEFFFTRGTGISTIKAYKKYRVLISLNDTAHMEM